MNTNKMNSISDVLNLIGFKSRTEQIAFVKLMAVYHCFIEPSENNAANKRVLLISELWKKCAFSGMNIELDSNHSDVQIEQLLSASFPSLAMACIWLSKILELYFRRETYDEEGIGKDKEQSGINTKIWNLPDLIKINEINKQDKLLSDVYQYLKTLKLFDSAPWPTEVPSTHIVILSSMSEFVQELVEFIPKFSIDQAVNIYFISGPRGLFNNEFPLAPILAEWFAVPDKITLIQQVLNKHLDFADPLSWTQNLTALKKEILKAIDKSTWCDAQDKSWYYHSPQPYENHTTNSGMESLKNWPVAMDMFAYFIKNRSISAKLIWVPAIGKNGRLNTSGDAIEAWYTLYGKQLIEQGEIPIFVASAEINRTLHTLRHLTLDKSFEDTFAKLSIISNLNKFQKNRVQDFTYDRYSSILVVGPPPKTFSIKRCLDILARSSLVIGKQIDFRIQEYIALGIEESQTNTQLALIKQINFYHTYEKFVLLSHASVNLALDYYTKHNFIKTAGLISFAQDVLQNNDQDKIGFILDKMCESLLTNMQQFILNSLNRLECSVKNSETELLKRDSLVNKKSLLLFRQGLEKKFNLIKPYDKDAIADLYKTCFEEIQQFLIQLINQSVTLLKPIDQRLFFAFLGSNASQKALPFSDLEFFILVDNNHFASEYAKEITKLLLLKIINLGETSLPALGISIKDNRGQELSLINNSFYRYSKRGLCFDYNDPVNACKTPLGAKIGDRILFRLIGTPQDLAALACTPGYQIYVQFPQVLRLSKPLLYGDLSLYQEFQQRLSDTNFDVKKYAHQLLISDINKYLPLLEELNTLTLINHKNYFYRSLTILLDGLYLLLAPVENKDAYTVTYLLFQERIINQHQKEFLEEFITRILYLRMQQGFINQQKTINISLLDEEGHYLRNVLQTYKALLISLRNHLLQNDKKESYKISNRPGVFFKPHSLEKKEELTNWAFQINK